MGYLEIEKVIGREIIDSRGNPTVEAEVYLTDGTIGRGAAPSGNDTLNKFLFGVFLFFLLVAIFSSKSSAANSIFNLLAIAVLVYSYFRIFSKNIARRQAENAKFLELTAPIRGFFGKKSGDKTHRIFQCPQCGQKVRVPKGKGKIEITCPNCRNHFIKRS